MRYKDIRRHLKAYSITASRTTTMNHAFAACIAPSDAYDDATVREGLGVLGQDPETNLVCAYCGAEAETWDHVHATVKDKAFSGFGHRIGNLLPCCKPCNSKKGNRDWRAFLNGLAMPEPLRRDRESRIDAYLKRYCSKDEIPDHLVEYQELQEILLKVLDLFKDADRLASIVRGKSGGYN
jgi:5-methylcytosine-specific restriction endonuclease McrA